MITVYGFRKNELKKINWYLKFRVIAFDISMRSLLSKDLKRLLNWKFALKFSAKLNINLILRVVWNSLWSSICWSIYPAAPSRFASGLKLCVTSVKNLPNQIYVVYRWLEHAKVTFNYANNSSVNVSHFMHIEDQMCANFCIVFWKHSF